MKLENVSWQIDHCSQKWMIGHLKLDAAGDRLYEICIFGLVLITVMLTYPVLTLSVFIPLPSLICWPPHHIPESQCRGDVPAHFGLGRQRQAARPKNPTHPPTQPLLWPLCKTELPTDSHFGKAELHTLDWNFCKQITSESGITQGLDAQIWLVMCKIY